MGERRVLIRSALALMVVAFISGPYVSGGPAGREFSMCVQRCNSLYAACNDACRQACETLTMDDPRSITECAYDCHQGCGASAQDCKATCRSIKDPQPPGARVRRS